MVMAVLRRRRSILAVLAGGFCGTLARFLLSTVIQGAFGKQWPYDILFINLSGALALALITVLADATVLIGPTRRLFLTVGFLGAYTTFSSLTLGAVLLLTSGRWLAGLLYLLASAGGGVLAILVGDWLGRGCLRLLQRRRRGPHKTASAVEAGARAQGLPAAADQPQEDSLAH